MYRLIYFIMFTVRQYLDKHFKLNGLGRAQDTEQKLVVVVVLGFGGGREVDSMLSSKLLYTGIVSPFSITSRRYCC